MDELEVNNNHYIYTNSNNAESVVFNASLLEKLQENYGLVIHYKDIVMEVPVDLLKTEKHITFQFAEAAEDIISKHNNHVSSIYDLTILFGDEVFSDFGEHRVTLTFTVNEDKIENGNELAVYLLDENGEKQQEIDVEYDKEQQIVIADVAHFSLYGVFENTTPNEEQTEDEKEDNEPETDHGDENPNEKIPEEESTTNNTDKDNTSNEKNEKSVQEKESPRSSQSQYEETEGQPLPDTATNQFNYILIGLLVITGGCILFFITRVRKYK
ncbi:LPXTG-motif cell wall anchor domain-containing protein [Gracilibacillus orientalis]|uniref:LPXTG-motif cell wall anchor domain-containing protein n=1 Tax=Gracilibacillus orientalis TaxID=334253 RepID=A0A1I4HJ00_9BACI|nr:LPXTG cell wall anchor domain-containing protein [Gracilibacillus orientalis]SFL42209.1 LPXTG-motif cell wall anchor domain-containing protein [Gracilibacillus orientalis]